MPTKRVHREEYTDDLGRTWAIEVEFHDGYSEMYVVAPDAERSRLTPKRPTVRPRPSVDSEEPLPLEIQ